MLKSMAENLPYPDISGIKPSFKDAAVISPAYADLHSELTAILQYIFHSLTFSELGDEENAGLLMRIGVAEMHHLHLLGEALSRLGVSPVFSRRPPNKCEFFSSGCVDYSTSPAAMLAADITGETEAIRIYECMLVKLNDKTLIDLISRIILDEKMHLAALKSAYRDLVGKNRQGSD